MHGGARGTKAGEETGESSGVRGVSPGSNAQGERERGGVAQGVRGSHAQGERGGVARGVRGEKG